MTIPTTERLSALRSLMSQWKGGDSTNAGLDAYVVPSEDAHGSEYIASCDERRAWISGFNGSAGCAIVTKNEAFLFTDGRYWLQASGQLDENWTLMKQGLKDVPTWQAYLSKNLPSKSLIGIDPTLIGASDAATIRSALTEISSSLVPVTENLVDKAWGSSQPLRPANKVFALSVERSGQSHQDKLAKVREQLKKLEDGKVKALVLTALDEIAWLFNLRGSDIMYNPVFFSYAIVPAEGDAFLFLQDRAEVRFGGSESLEGVRVNSYHTFWTNLKAVVDGCTDEEKILVPSSASLAVSTVIGDKSFISSSPISLLKAIKNPVELDGFRNAHVRDGVALVRYFSWLEEKLNKNGEEGKVNEWDAALVLEGYRSELEHFQGLSFDTISSTGKNAAVIHYSPPQVGSEIIDKDEIYLCDSGAQFLDGTTDVTRTWHFGTPRPEEIRAFTRVLQGHIAIDTAIFPGDTSGYLIDSWARRYLWKDGLDYRHGTGHGVGHFLIVHEGPHGIGTRIAYNAVPLQAGMVVSNEPGYYEDGKFGIRIESVVLVKELTEKMGQWGGEEGKGFGAKGWFGFERVTMCPIQKKLVDKSLLSQDEVDWLDAYHAEVLAKVGPLLGHDKRARSWLEKECTEL